MRRLALTFLLIYLFIFYSSAKSEYNFLNLTAEVSQENDKLIHISWNNNDEFQKDLNEGNIKDAFVEFDIKFDQGKYLSERNKEVVRVPATDCKVTLNPFADKKDLSTDNTLVFIRMRYVYKKGEMEVKSDYIEPIVLGQDSFIRNMSSWSKKEFSTANKMGLVLSSFKDDVSRPITRYEFIKVLMKLNVFIGKQPEEITLRFEDIDDKDVNAAYNLGIIKGVDGNIFAGEKNLSKEEMATIIHRYIKTIGLKSKNTVAEYVVNDMESVSSWARESVQEILKFGIIKGDNYHNINPKKDVTCEEAIVMVVRVLESRSK